MLETTVVVIGGGATGMGTLRDLCMRGVPAILLEQGGLAHGTSSRFHGLRVLFHLLKFGHTLTQILLKISVAHRIGPADAARP